jgi:hypothetical protein
MTTCEHTTRPRPELHRRPVPVAVPPEPTPWERELGVVRPRRPLDRVDVVLDPARSRPAAARDART